MARDSREWGRLHWKPRSATDCSTRGGGGGGGVHGGALWESEQT